MVYILDHANYVKLIELNYMNLLTYDFSVLVNFI